MRVLTGHRRPRQVLKRAFFGSDGAAAGRQPVREGGAQMVQRRA